MEQFEKRGAKIFCLKTCYVMQSQRKQNSAFLKYNDLGKNSSTLNTKLKITQLTMKEHQGVQPVELQK